MLDNNRCMNNAVEQWRARVRVGSVKRGEKGEYVGRSCYGRKGSVLGNRFVVGVHGARGECCKLYAVWLREQIEAGNMTIVNELTRLARVLRARGSLTLVCWCAPAACHAEAIADAVAQIAAGIA